MALTPEQAKKWMSIVGAAAVAIGGAVTSTVQWAKAEGIWGGKLEKANLILAGQHIGEDPTKTTVILKTDSEYQAVVNYENGDTLFYWKYREDGSRKKLKRWTSKKSLDEILEMAEYKPRFNFINSAYAGGLETKPQVAFDADEVYVGKTEVGYSVYYIKSEMICDVVDEGTGDIIETLVPPCEQYVVE